MKTILSIQSHVTYGYVGNKAATFPLQTMGYNVLPVNTVQFSNHTGYKTYTGQSFDSNHIQDLLSGLKEQGLFETIDGVLSGYIADASIGKVVIETLASIKAENPDVIYCCDPVMGDTGHGLFVKENIPPFFKSKAIGAANIITPNQFELSLLADQDVITLEDARNACTKLHAQGPKIILVTSLETAETSPDEIQMLASINDGSQFIISNPKVQLSPEPNGAGDLTSALFLGHYLAGEAPKTILENTANSVLGVFEKTEWIRQNHKNNRELALIESQDCFRSTATGFKAHLL